MWKRMKQRWDGPGGCGEVLRMAFPLILSTSSYTIQLFVDRMFLTRYSTDTISAATPAGVAAFVFISLFSGTAGYVNTFVAQYIGAGRPQRVGPAIWQGIYFSLATVLLMLPVFPAAQTIFDWFGHAPEVRRHEVVYFKIMCVGVLPTVLASTVSCFFTGRGRMWTVFIVNALATAINVVLDYAMIFGNWGFPRWGIAGAGWATVIAETASAAIFLTLFLRGKYRRKYASWQGSRLEPGLFWRLMKYGLPNGVQFMLDILSFTFLVAFIGRIDKISLAASNIAFQINMLAFLPMVGFGIALTTLVGQAIGRNEPAAAERATWSAFLMTYGYMALIAISYWLAPAVFIGPFKSAGQADQFTVIASLVATLLKFVAVYCLFDTGNIIFSAALKGAGDTRFVMIMSGALSWTIMVVPAWSAVTWKIGPGDGLYVAWAFLTLYVCILAMAFWLRFRQGRWKTMKVIEPVVVHPLPVVTEAPILRSDGP
jgi:multidrug resistance protein, MATE family